MCEDVAGASQESYGHDRSELCSDAEHMDRYKENCTGQGKVYIGLAK